MSPTSNLPAQRGEGIIERRLPGDPAQAAQAVALLKNNPKIHYLGLDWTPDGRTQVVRFVLLANTRPIERPATPQRRISRGWLIAGVTFGVVAALCGGGFLWVRSMSTIQMVLTIACAIAVGALVWKLKSRSAPGQGGMEFSGTFKGTIK